MRKFIAVLMCGLFYMSSYATEVGDTTVSELLDEARTSLKRAYEVQADKKAKYEFNRAKSFFEIAQEQTSKLNLKVGKAAALESIEWSIKAISKSISGGAK
ncbi:MAG: hypothetical protein GXO22_08375 [Aquificae bacterium]|nr:hypothetical protein [Aquificota bacterium]